MKESLCVIKIGGDIIDHPDRRQQFLVDFANIKEHKILVHGGGKLATELANRMQLPQQMIEGRRVTDSETLKLVTMVYGGLINRSIVAALAAVGVCAIGLSGADGMSVTAEKRPSDPIDFGFVGDVKEVHVQNIVKLIDAGFIPVFCALTHDGKGQMLNTNADTMAAALAKALSEHYECKLLFGFEKKGVLEDMENENSVIKEINEESYQQLKSLGKINKGMIPKIENAFSALDNGVASVYILHANACAALITNKNGNGTRITK